MQRGRESLICSARRKRGLPARQFQRLFSSTAPAGSIWPGRAPGDGDRNLLRGIHAPLPAQPVVGPPLRRGRIVSVTRRVTPLTAHGVRGVLWTLTAHGVCGVRCGPAPAPLGAEQAIESPGRRRTLIPAHLADGFHEGRLARMSVPADAGPNRIRHTPCDVTVKEPPFADCSTTAERL